MPDADTKFAMLDEAEIAAATLRRDPYDYAFAEQAIFPGFQLAMRPRQSTSDSNSNGRARSCRM